MKIEHIDLSATLVGGNDKSNWAFRIRCYTGPVDVSSTRVFQSCLSFDHNHIEEYLPGAVRTIGENITRLLNTEDPDAKDNP